MTESVECDGACDEHVGPIQQVHVVNPEDGKDWGLFNYCTVAINRDREDRFTVTVVEDSND